MLNPRLWLASLKIRLGYYSCDLCAGGGHAVGGRGERSRGGGGRRRSGCSALAQRWLETNSGSTYTGMTRLDSSCQLQHVQSTLQILQNLFPKVSFEDSVFVMFPMLTKD